MYVEDAEEAMTMLDLDLGDFLRWALVDVSSDKPFAALSAQAKIWRDEGLAFRKVQVIHLDSNDLNLRSEKITNFIEEKMVKDMGLEDPVVRLTSMRNAGIISSSEMEEGIEELR